MAKKELKEKKQEEVKSQLEHSMKQRPVSSRGRIFQGIVIAKFPKRITIELERTIYIPKYERYMKKQTRIHARLPEEFRDTKIGDLVKVRECRPLSKIIHFIMTEIVKKSEEGQ